MNTAAQYTWLIVFLPQATTQFFFPDPTSTTPCLFISCQFLKVDSGIFYLAAILQIEAELFSISASISDKLLSDQHLIFLCLIFPFLFLNMRIQKMYPYP